MTRAVHRSYYEGHRRAGQVTRLHIMREDGPWAGKQSMCGQPMWNVSKSSPVMFDPMPNEPPPGLMWCPHCIGRLAERLGHLSTIAADLARIGAAL